MSNYSFATNNSTANRCGGTFAARTSAVLLIAGIAMAMSVLFFLDGALLVRLCTVILAVVIFIGLLLVSPLPRRRKG